MSKSWRRSLAKNSAPILHSRTPARSHKKIRSGWIWICSTIKRDGIKKLFKVMLCLFSKCACTFVTKCKKISYTIAKTLKNYNFFRNLEGFLFFFISFCHSQVTWKNIFSIIIKRRFFCNHPHLFKFIKYRFMCTF